MKQTKQADTKPKKLVIHKDSVRTLASDAMKQVAAAALLTPCIRCGTTR